MAPSDLKINDLQCHGGSKCRQVGNRVNLRLILYLLGACFVYTSIVMVIFDETYLFDTRPIDTMRDFNIFYLIPNITSFNLGNQTDSLSTDSLLTDSSRETTDSLTISQLSGDGSNQNVNSKTNPPTNQGSNQDTKLQKGTKTTKRINSDLKGTNRPNILFILADDFGHRDIGYNAELIRTPNLDKLAANGLRLTNYYTLCICSASRGVILTGRYDIRNGMRGIATQRGRKGVALHVPLISDLLYVGGYSTYCIGKWHIGKASWLQTPTHRGFEYFYGMLGGQSNYFTVC